MWLESFLQVWVLALQKILLDSFLGLNFKPRLSSLYWSLFWFGATSSSGFNEGT
jgi:hypothetical protein